MISLCESVLRSSTRGQPSRRMSQLCPSVWLVVGIYERQLISTYLKPGRIRAYQTRRSNKAAFLWQIFQRALCMRVMGMTEMDYELLHLHRKFPLELDVSKRVLA